MAVSAGLRRLKMENGQAEQSLFILFLSSVYKVKNIIPDEPKLSVRSFLGSLVETS